MNLFFFIVLLIGAALLASGGVCAVVVFGARRKNSRKLGPSPIWEPEENIGEPPVATAGKVAGGSLHPSARGGGNVRTARPTPTTLRRECAWCGGFLGGDPASPQITHGICPPCRERTLEAAGIVAINTVTASTS